MDTDREMDRRTDRPKDRYAKTETTVYRSVSVYEAERDEDDMKCRWVKQKIHEELEFAKEMWMSRAAEVPFEIGKRWDEHPEFHNLHTLKLGCT